MRPTRSARCPDRSTGRSTERPRPTPGSGPVPTGSRPQAIPTRGPSWGGARCGYRVIARVATRTGGQARPAAHARLPRVACAASVGVAVGTGATAGPHAPVGGEKPGSGADRDLHRLSSCRGSCPVLKSDRERKASTVAASSSQSSWTRFLTLKTGDRKSLSLLPLGLVADAMPSWPSPRSSETTT